MGVTDVDISICIETLVCAYRDGRSIVERVKGLRAASHAPPPLSSRALEESLDQSPVDILNEKNKNTARLGREYQDGDNAAIIALQQLTIALQSRLLGLLRDATDEGDVGEHFTEATAYAYWCRDKAIEVLTELAERLMHADSPLEDSNGSRVSRRPSVHDIPVLKSSQESSPTRGPDPTHMRTWTREYSGFGDEDVGSGADEPQTRSRRPRHSSLLGFLRHPRTSSELNVARPDNPRRISWNRTSAPGQTPSQTPQLSRTNSYSPQKGEEASPKFTYEEGDGAISSRRVTAQPNGQSRRDTLSVPPDAYSPPTFVTSSRKPGCNSVPNPNPDNDYLGFCKGAWRLQTGDRKAMQKCKEFNDGWSHSSVYYLSCAFNKCAFASHIDINIIWTKVFTTKGLKFRWPFLAKSHVTQSRVKDNEFAFQCVFCVYLGNAAPVMHGTDLYLDHILQEHRGRVMSDVILHKTECVNDRICEDTETFDINIYPLTLEEEVAFRRRRGSEVLPDELLLGSAKRDLDRHLQDATFANEPWNEGLSEFHVDGEIE